VVLINVHPVQRYLGNPVHKITTVASLYILKVIWYIKQCKDSEQQNVQIHNYNSWIYMYNFVIQSSNGKVW